MKKIHKKIGAMALAGMVVAGGVAASGVSSHAASYSKGSINNLDRLEKRAYDEVEELLHKLGGNNNKKVGIVAVSSSEHAMFGYIKEKFPKIKDRLLPRLGVGERISILESVLKDEMRLGKMFVHIKYDGLYFLIRLR